MRPLLLSAAFVLIQLLLWLSGQQSWLAFTVQLALSLTLLAFWYRRRPAALASSRASSLPTQAKLELALGDQHPNQLRADIVDEALASDFQLQLLLLQRSLDLGAAVLVGPGPGHHELQVLTASTSQAVNFRPFNDQKGIFGIFEQGRQQISGHPRMPNYGGLPYYANKEKVGGFYGIRLDFITAKQGHYFLCVDRPGSEPWQDDDKVIIQATAEKMVTDLHVANHFKQLGLEQQATNQVCLALQELNAALGEETALDAVERAISELTGAEFIALTRLTDEHHHILRASGPQAEELNGLALPRSQAGLIEQVTQLRHEMPYKMVYQGEAPVFSPQHRLKGFNSLLVLPLLRDHDQAIGTLVMAGRQPGLFDQERLHILKVISSQIATKLDLAQAHEEINRLATTDSLTNLANRRSMQIGFELMLKRAKRTETPLAVILCDIDFFKKINDSYGHPFGDQVLRSVAAILKKSMRAVDLACRYGGEEFLLILENSDLEGGLLLAERVRQQVAREAFSCDGQTVQVTMSFGVASTNQHGKEPQLLIDQADQALYRAKENGRNQSQAAA